MNFLEFLRNIFSFKLCTLGGSRRGAKELLASRRDDQGYRGARHHSCTVGRLLELHPARIEGSADRREVREERFVQAAVDPGEPGDVLRRHVLRQTPHGAVQVQFCGSRLHSEDAASEMVRKPRLEHAFFADGLDAQLPRPEPWLASDHALLDLHVRPSGSARSQPGQPTTARADYHPGDTSDASETTCDAREAAFGNRRSTLDPQRIRKFSFS